jgi:hypothetical protein
MECVGKQKKDLYSLKINEIYHIPQDVLATRKINIPTYRNCTVRKGYSAGNYQLLDKEFSRTLPAPE